MDDDVFHQLRRQHLIAAHAIEVLETAFTVKDHRLRPRRPHQVGALNGASPVFRVPPRVRKVRARASAHALLTAFRRTMSQQIRVLATLFKGWVSWPHWFAAAAVIQHSSATTALARYLPHQFRDRDRPGRTVHLPCPAARR